MTRVMYDGITPASVPKGGDFYGGYVAGNWPDFAQLLADEPGAHLISIAVQADEYADCLDVETGDATPVQAPGWAERQRADGNPYPWVYMNQSTWPDVIAAFTAQNVAPPLYWVANYNGDPTIPAGAIAKQHTNTPGYDKSSVADYVPGIDPPEDPMTAADIAAINAHTDTVAAAIKAEIAAAQAATIAQVQATGGVLYGNDGPNNTPSHPNSLTSINTRLGQLAVTVSAPTLAAAIAKVLPSGTSIGIDVNALATAVVSELGQQLADTSTETAK